MHQRVLVPLDGSARAEQALPVAARMVRAFGGSIILVRVANIHLEYGPYLDTAALTPLAIDRDYDEAVAYLKLIARRDDLRGITTHIEVLAGPVAETILATAETLDADVIVMNSHGRTGFSRWVLGSVAEQVVRHANIPVLVLRAGGSMPLPSEVNADRPLTALVPLDGSPLAESVLLSAAEMLVILAGASGGTLQLLQVVDVPFPRKESGTFAESKTIDTSTRDSIYAEAQQYLANIARRLRDGLSEDANLRITTSVAFDVDAAKAIIDVAEGRGDAQHRAVIAPCQLIAMATHGRGGLAHWAMGSVTERVLEGTNLPMLVVRPFEITAERQHSVMTTADRASGPSHSTRG